MQRQVQDSVKYLWSSFFFLRKWSTAKKLQIFAKKALLEMLGSVLNILHKSWSFPLRTFSVNVTKSAVFCWFVHMYWRNPSWKTPFFVQWYASWFFGKILNNFREIRSRQLHIFGKVAVLNNFTKLTGKHR